MAENLRNRLYEAYASTHAGLSDGPAEMLAFRRDILPHLPPSHDAIVVDLGCGQGQLVGELLRHGYHRSTGIDISPEQVAIAHAAGLTQVHQGDFREYFDGRPVDVITATDFFEHLTKDEALRAMDHISAALRPDGVLIARVPNAVSPFFGNYTYGDLTHERPYTARSLRQLGAAVGLDDVRVFACPPPIHGAKSAARAVVWRAVSGVLKLAMAAETGMVHGHVVTQNLVATFRRGRREQLS